jgi:hypothetical protein
VTDTAAPTLDNGRNGRDERGRFSKGNTAALVHGAYAEVQIEQALPAITSLADAIRTDKGKDVSAVMTDLILDYARASVLAETIFANLTQQGTAAGRVIERFRPWSIAKSDSLN